MQNESRRLLRPPNTRLKIAHLLINYNANESRRLLRSPIAKVNIAHLLVNYHTKWVRWGGREYIPQKSWIMTSWATQGPFRPLDYAAIMPQTMPQSPTSFRGAAACMLAWNMHAFVHICNQRLPCGRDMHTYAGICRHMHTYTGECVRSQA